MPMLAELVDAVVGVDTHRDTHQVEIADPNGVPIATCSITNDTTGYAQVLAWIFDHAPGPRLVVSIEGTRSYGLGLTRAITAAGLDVVECGQPNRRARRAKGKSDAIDAHLAVLAALRLDADRLPTPRADGDREALRILLSARNELTTVSTAQTNRLRALLLNGEDPDRHLARAALTDPVLAGLARRRQPRDASCEQAVRHAEIRRLAIALRETARALKANRAQLHTIADGLAPGLTDLHGVGPVSAAQVIVSFSHPGRCRNDAAFAALAGTSPLQASSGRTARHRLNRGGDRGLNRAIHTIATTRMRSCPGLHRPPRRRRHELTRDPPMPEALHHPPALPHPHQNHNHNHASLNLGTHLSRLDNT